MGLTATQAMAQQSPWQVRARAVNISPDTKSDPVGGVGAADTIHVSNKTIAEVDITYFVTPNWSAELILTYPQSMMWNWLAKTSVTSNTCHQH